MMAFLTVALAIFHSLAGLAILIVSSWFIAACAIAAPGFNYMLPAVVIRALALLRIGSGYAHMWVGHQHLLGLTANLRLTLFARLQSQKIHSRSEEVEALASHTEAVAALWVGWVSQQASAVMMLLMSCIGLWWLNVPLGGWVWILAVSWLIVMAILCLLGLTYAEEIARWEYAFRQHSEAQLAAAPIWHIKPGASLLDMMPKAIACWRANMLLQKRVLQAQWVFQSVAWLLLLAAFLALIHTHPNPGKAEPLLLIVPMLLLSAGDWLGRSYNTQPALNKAVQGNRKLNTLPSGSLNLLPGPPVEGAVTLCNFRSANLPEQCINAELPVNGIVWVTGPSGAGKSQLLQAIAGVEKSNGERMCANNILPSGLVPGWLYLEQQPMVLAATLKHNLCLGKAFRDTELSTVLIEVGLSHLVELGEWLGPGGRQLSGGERKRLNIARAMLHNGTMWLVDEPFEGLDLNAISSLMTLIESQANCRLIVIASHVIPAGVEPLHHIKV
ncbi:ATP-binding cassette domain-containing protein [Aestuariibacter sp. GS-14]|uniref:ATP-binding cassette domain-containing protein n=1 Tax=Aestuariibacter sp. GS-14 TaxID=2590670 RepID=UPI001126721D|nr:ATP-binding cassette domain-containing protein [Aestuariibacter sp. GS-14]TPV58495.1 ATP-binding cassette domain-containing protein [Aestuariibacter sp. GS-14]